MNFPEYLFSLKRIVWTLIINLGALRFYYLVWAGSDWFISRGWLIVIFLGVTIVVMNYWFLSYSEWKEKYKQDKKP